jgi:hypothetical protein
MRARRWAISAGVLFAVLAAAALAWPAILWKLCQRGAREQGLVLEQGKASLWLGALDLTGVRARVVAAPSVEVVAARVHVDLNRLTPTRIELDEPGAEVDDPAGALALFDLISGPVRFGAPLDVVGKVSLVMRHAATGLPYGLTLGAEEARFTSAGVVTLTRVAAELTAAPAPLAMSAASLELAYARAKVDDLRVRSGGTTAGPVDLDATITSPRVAVTVRGASDSRTLATLTMDVDKASATIVVPHRSAAELARVAGVSSPGTFTVEAKAELFGGDAPHGSVAMTLDGYALPHPHELDGVVFGTRTAVSSEASLEPSGDVAVNDFRIEAGALKLKGTGRYRAAKGVLGLELDGPIPCSALAASAIAAHFGPTASLFLGALARGNLTGTVMVHLGVQVDRSDPGHPKVSPSAAVRCGL